MRDEPSFSLFAGIRGICTGTDIEIVQIKRSSVDVMLPYDSAVMSIDLEGDNDVDRYESFKSGVDHRLQQMIDHLEGCKL